ATCCGLPLSEMEKSSLESVPTNCPAGSLTVASTRTRFTSTLITVCCATAVAASKTPVLSALSHGRMFVPLSFHPDLAILEMLFFPDGDQALQPVDAFERRVEGGFAMRSCHDDGYAGLADQQAPQSVHHGNAVDVVAARNIA